MTSGTSWREELVRRLELDPPLLETFVLLWSYFEEAGLRRAENRLSELKIHPLRTEQILPKIEEQAWFREKQHTLRSLSGKELDRFAVEWLRSIDKLLKHKPEQLHPKIIRGLDGHKLYRVHKRREILAEWFIKKVKEEGKQAAAWVGAQNNAIETYTPFHKAVRADRVGGCQIVTNSFGRQEQSRLRVRLESDWLAGHFRVMLWPLETRIRYLGLGRKDLSQGSGPEVNFVHLRQVENEPELIAEIPKMLAAAQEEKATLLLLPELAVPPKVEAEIQRLLADRPGHDYPLLTLFGRCHRPASEQDIDVNDAVLLGPDGTEVHSHRKLVPYTGLPKDEAVYLSENLETGDTLTVLELPFGNLCVVICADLFQMKRLLEDSHATLLAVPSLSSKTSAHHDAAKALANKNRACTFVTNRWFGAHSAETTSFYQLPLKKEDGGYKAHIEDQKDGEPPPPCPSYLLFSLL